MAECFLATSSDILIKPGFFVNVIAGINKSAELNKNWPQRSNLITGEKIEKHEPSVSQANIFPPLHSILNYG